MNHKKCNAHREYHRMSARRVSNPNINKTEQNTSPNMASIKEISLPTPNGSGNASAICPKIVNLGQSVHHKEQPEKEPRQKQGKVKSSVPG